MATPDPCLHVCTTCRADQEAPIGQALFDAVRDILDRDAPALLLRPVVCLGNCAQGCSAAVTQEGKWSYLLGHMRPGQAADLVGYALAYGASDSGTVWRSGRAASLRDAIVARIPGHGFTQKETA